MGGRSLEALIRALVGAARSVVHPVILAILLVPMLLALAAWAGLAWTFWDTWTSAIQVVVQDQAGFTWAARWDLGKDTAVVAATAVVVLLIPAVMITSTLIAAAFAMPVLVGHVARRDFPGLERRSGGTAIGSLWNGCIAIGVFLSLWLVTLPLWLLGAPGAVLPLLLSAYLNQRLFRYDALSEHADSSEMKRIFDKAGGRLFLLGLATGVLYFIPPINLVAPVYAALAFVHLCLGELQALRSGELSPR